MSAARQLLESALVVDATVPWLREYWDETLLRRLHRAGVDCVSLTVQDFPASHAGCLQAIAEFRQVFAAALDDWLCWADSPARIRQAREQGRLAVVINVQDTVPLGQDLERVEAFYAAGVRHMLLAYQGRSFAADGCAEPADAKLSLFGRRLVARMNEVGMLVDLSHTGRSSALEASELSASPVIYSHSGVRALCEHIRNIDEAQIRACVQTDGVIGICGIGAYLGDPQARAPSMFRHIDHIVQTHGPRHVGIGSDYLADMEVVWRHWPGPSDSMPDPSGTQLYEGRAYAPEQHLQLVQLMLEHGYGQSAIHAILGNNFMRVFDAAWQARTNQ